jgi:preprotein translocase subunit SecD
MVGAPLGADAIRAGVVASVAGLALVVGFMVVWYRGAGVNAIVAMCCNLILLLGIMGQLGAVMTLPGIAGFVLTIGMGVDSSVLIFERIKEERKAHRSAVGAVRASFERVWLTLLDTHVSALIAAAFLFQFGTVSIQGFAVTLAAGLVVNLFTSTVVSRTGFELVLHRRHAALSI